MLLWPPLLPAKTFMASADIYFDFLILEYFAFKVLQILNGALPSFQTRTGWRILLRGCLLMQPPEQFDKLKVELPESDLNLEMPGTYKYWPGILHVTG